MVAAIAFLTTLLGFLNRVWPDKATEGEIAREKLEKIHNSEQKYNESGDTSDLGRLP